MVSYKLTTLLVAATLSLGVFAAVDTSGSHARKAVNIPRAAAATAKPAAKAAVKAAANAAGTDDLPEEDLGMGPPPSKGRKSVKPAGGAAEMEDEAFEAAPLTKVRKTGKTAGASSLASKKDEDLETDSEGLDGADVDGMDEASLEDEDDEGDDEEL